MLKVITNFKPMKRLSIGNLNKPRRRKDSHNTLETAPSDGSASSTWLHNDPSFELPEDDPSTSTSSSAAGAHVSSTPATPLHTATTSSSRNGRKHRRLPCLANDDFDELLSKSRGWTYDPSEPPSPRRSSRHHHDRSRNKALAQTDFERFIFRSIRSKEGNPTCRVRCVPESLAHHSHRQAEF